MSEIGQYILSVSATALICAVTEALTRKGSAGEEVIRLLTGLIMLLVAIRPLLSINLSQVAYDTRDFFAQGEQIAQEAEENALARKREIISAGIEAYILDKAENLDAKLCLEVGFEEETDVPVSVTLTGQVSPYDKIRLQHAIEEELGISREEQIWNP